MLVATKPRVFLAGHGKKLPRDVKHVLDDEQHLWTRGADGDFHMGDRHHQTVAKLRARTDLVEVIGPWS